MFLTRLLAKRMPCSCAGFCGIFLVLSALCLSEASAEPAPTALDRYVAAKDTVYSWKLQSTISGDGYKAFVLELTSQTWRSASEVDRPVWKHWLTITRPENIKVKGAALLFIGGGSNLDPAPQKASDRSTRLALDSGTIVADLGMVPNQPLYFNDSKSIGRKEDDLIAYSRVKHFSTNDDSWLVRLAMVKSGVRAMDAIQEFTATRAGGGDRVERFVVAGGSKRGWTTWLVGAVDPRVVAIAPMVIDALNSEAITRHHFEVYGFFAPSLKDYVNHGLFPHKIGTAEYKKVLDIEDPYVYRERPAMNMPKFLINASGDEFFLPDNSQYYYSQLPEEKHLRYVPNAKHNLAGSDAMESLTAFYEAILSGKKRPRFTWTKSGDGAIIVKPADKPSEVTLWQATNPNARDFRLDVIGKAYQPTKLVPRPDGSYIAKPSTPSKGFTAFYVEITFPSGGTYPFKFSTEVSIVPDVVPFRFADAAAKYPLQ